MLPRIVKRVCKTPLLQSSLSTSDGADMFTLSFLILIHITICEVTNYLPFIDEEVKKLAQSQTPRRRQLQLKPVLFPKRRNSADFIGGKCVRFSW
jgi:hypothetical protein